MKKMYLTAVVTSVFFIALGQKAFTTEVEEELNRRQNQSESSVSSGLCVASSQSTQLNEIDCIAHNNKQLPEKSPDVLVLELIKNSSYMTDQYKSKLEQDFSRLKISYQRYQMCPKILINNEHMFKTLNELRCLGLSDKIISKLVPELKKITSISFEKQQGVTHYIQHIVPNLNLLNVTELTFEDFNEENENSNSAAILKQLPFNLKNLNLINFHVVKSDPENLSFPSLQRLTLINVAFNNEWKNAIFKSISSSLKQFQITESNLLIENLDKFTCLEYFLLSMKNGICHENVDGNLQKLPLTVRDLSINSLDSDFSFNIKTLDHIESLENLEEASSVNNTIKQFQDFMGKLPKSVKLIDLTYEAFTGTDINSFLSKVPENIEILKLYGGWILSPTNTDQDITSFVDGFPKLNKLKKLCTGDIGLKKIFLDYQLTGKLKKAGKLPDDCKKTNH